MAAPERRAAALLLLLLPRLCSASRLPAADVEDELDLSRNAGEGGAAALLLQLGSQIHARRDAKGDPYATLVRSQPKSPAEFMNLFLSCERLGWSDPDCPEGDFIRDTIGNVAEITSSIESLPGHIDAVFDNCMQRLAASPLRWLIPSLNTTLSGLQMQARGLLNYTQEVMAAVEARVADAPVTEDKMERFEELMTKDIAGFMVQWSAVEWWVQTMRMGVSDAVSKVPEGLRETMSIVEGQLTDKLVTVLEHSEAFQDALWKASVSIQGMTGATLAEYLNRVRQMHSGFDEAAREAQLLVRAFVDAFEVLEY